MRVAMYISWVCTYVSVHEFGLHMYMYIHVYMYNSWACSLVHKYTLHVVFKLMYTYTCTSQTDVYVHHVHLHVQGYKPN